MFLLQREWLLWRRRTTLWVILGIVIVMAYFGYIDYLDPGLYRTQGGIIEAAATWTEEEKDLAYHLLAQTIWSMEANNSLFMILPLFLIGMSFGTEIHSRRTRGARLAGMQPEQMFWYSFGMNVLLSLGLIVLGVLISLWKLHGLWWGRLDQASALFLLRPPLKVLLSTFLYVSLAYLCFALLGEWNLVIPYLVYIFGGLLLGRGMQAVASLLAWGDIGGTNGRGFQTYYFYDVDQGGLQNSFLGGTVEDPLQWKVWGETMLIAYLVVGAVLLFVAWKVFKRSQKAI